MCFQDYFLSWARRRTLTRLRTPASLCSVFGENLRKQARNGTKRFAYLPRILCDISPKNQHKCRACPSMLRSLVSPTTHKRAGRGPCPWSMAKALHRSNASCTLRLWITAEGQLLNAKTAKRPRSTRGRSDSRLRTVQLLCPTFVWVSAVSPRYPVLAVTVHAAAPKPKMEVIKQQISRMSPLGWQRRPRTEHKDIERGVGCV